MDRNFRREERLRAERDFKAVYSRGRRLRGQSLTLLFLPNDLSHGRLGVVASKHIGKAVKRNRIKRLLREAYRLNKHLLKVPCDVVLVALPSETAPELSGIEPEIRSLFLKANARLRAE